jgi:hypothetical protein
VLQVLWAAGLTVGHSFRSPRECVTAARNDLHSRTALGDARLVAGHAPLFRALLGRLESDLFSSRRATLAFLNAVRAEVAERQARFGNAVGVIEPNLKESPGGLRDLHAVFWVAHALFRLHGLVGLRDGKWMSEPEYVRLRARSRSSGACGTSRTWPPAAETFSPSTCSPSWPRSWATARRAGSSPPRSSCASTTAARPRSTSSTGLPPPRPEPPSTPPASGSSSAV